MIRSTPLDYYAAQRSNRRPGRFAPGARSEAECSPDVLLLGGGAKRSRERAAAKGAARINSLVASTTLLLNISCGPANKAGKLLARNIGLPIGRPLGKGNGRGTGRLLDAADADRALAVKIVLKHERGTHRVAVIRNYETQLVGLLPRIHRRSRLASGDKVEAVPICVRFRMVSGANW